VVAGAAAAAVVLLVGWLALRPGPRVASAPSDGLPGPIGGANVAQDIRTLVGNPAPAFALPDSEGKTHTVTPGGGKPLVLVFHMGIL
jgi:hypothetical protein